MSARLRIVVVDDDPLARTALTMILDAQADLQVVGEAGDGVEGIEVAAREQPDVVLMDIRMPRLDGIEATRRLTSLDPPPGRVLALTTFGDEEYVYEVLRAGASGFLLKNTPAERLAEAVRIVAAGESLLAPAVTRMVIERYVAARPATEPGPEALQRLTPREREVMRQMARGLSNQEIAALLVLGQATVKTHVARILMKLALRDRAQVVVIAYECGLVTPGEPV
jgi:DNA-binding NarL/FixJ family response regulator